LIERLTGRGTDSEEKLKERFAKAEKELKYAPQFDIILKNYDLETACKEARNW
jgi:guanylate kinase